MGLRDLLEPAPPPEADEAELPTRQKWLWFFGLMALGVGVVAGSAYVMRALLFL
ncbi:MAG: hypothetical protein QNI84_04830 [Henriciella sp.]|nr:hypothetical protein [Henriciella sp.]